MSAVVAPPCSGISSAGVTARRVGRAPGRRAPAERSHRAGPDLLLGGGGLLLRGLGRACGGGLVTMGATLLREPRLELSLPGQAAHLHRPPIVSSSHRPAILVRVGAVKSSGRRR